MCRKPDANNIAANSQRDFLLGKRWMVQEISTTLLGGHFEWLGSG